jgi:hypothetical protein
MDLKNDSPHRVAWKLLNKRHLIDLTDRIIYEYLLQLDGNSTSPPLQVGVALLRVREVEADGDKQMLAHWRAADFFVPESLSGSGIHSRFLDRLIAELSGNVAWIWVTLHEEFSGRRDEAARRARLDIIGFYKSRQFVALSDRETEARAHWKWSGDGGNPENVLAEMVYDCRRNRPNGAGQK